MKKKQVVVSLASVFILLSGICYSCAYGDAPSPLLISALSPDKASEEADASETDPPKGQGSASGAEMSNLSGPKEEAIGLKEAIYVHVCGAVVNPGVYQVEPGTRLNNLISLSGGFREDAAKDYMNLAATVFDGERIYIPTLDEVKELPATEYQLGEQSNRQNEVSNTLVNINTADVNELMTLPGIGQAKAESIVDYRTSKGNFQSKEELMEIPGIKEGLFQKLADKVTVK